MRIIWREQARNDLREAVQYLRERDPNFALSISQTIRRKVTLLADHPHLGRAGRVANTRELVIAGTRYIVAYTVDNVIDAVIILRVLHGRRLWPEEFNEADE
jgi:addiction module RelE/StbE family toxin